jgi:hypothetical protein
MALTASGAAAATLCVNPAGSGGCYATIQAAVTAAAPLDKVAVAAGTYYENVIVPAGKDGLLINGVSRTLTVLDADNYTDRGITTHTGAGIQILAANVTVRNLTIRNGQAAGIDVEAPGAVVFGVNCTGQDLAGVYVGSANAYNVLVTLSEIHNTALGVFSAGFGTLVKNNLITNTVFGLDLIGDGAQAVSNKVLNSAGVGILIAGDGAVAQTNDVRYGGVGIQTTGSFPTVRLNRVSGQLVGIESSCTNCFGGSVSSNLISDAGGPGLVASSDSAGLTVQFNSILRAGFGIAAQGTGIFLTSNRATDVGSFSDGYCLGLFGDVNVANKNVLTRCQGSGIYVNGSSNSLTGNVATATFENGVTIDGDASPDPPFSGNTLTANRTSGNLGQGIAIINAADLTRLTFNSASKNRTDFCDEGTNTSAASNTFGTTSASCPIVH